MAHKAKDQKVLVIGWDAADWRVIRPLIEEGKMPNLQKLMESGVHGNISTLTPALSPMLWTSIATGKRPYKHGIHGFTEPTPDGSSVRPITNISRDTKAIWNILQQCGKRSIVVGWWPSHPAEPIDGVMVSNYFQRPIKLNVEGVDAQIGLPRAAESGWTKKEWPIAPGTVHPAELTDRVAEFRFHPVEVTAEHIYPFIPELGKIDQNKDKRLLSFCKVLSETVTIQGASTALMQLEDWDLMCVYFDGIDHFSHGFMKYHPPRQDWVSEEDFEKYKGVIEGGYRFHDMMLGAMMQLVDDDTTLILLSDHGFHPDHLRPQHIPAEPAGPAVEHRDHGIFVMKGPGIRKGEQIHGVSILDICPTILAHLDLPVGSDMDGKPLVTAFEDAINLDIIDSWDDVEGECGMHPPDAHIDAVESAEAIRQLVDLGYIEEPDEDTEVAVRESVRELKYNLARAHLDGGQAHKAIPLFEEIWEEWPTEHRFGLGLISAHDALGNQAGMMKTLGQLKQKHSDCWEKAMEELPALAEEAAEYGIQLPSIEVDDKGRKVLAPSEGQPSDRGDYKEPPRELTYRIRRHMALLMSIDHITDWYTTRAVLAGPHPQRALPYLKVLESHAERLPEVHGQLGLGYMLLGEYEKSLESHEKILERDPDNFQAHLGAARALIELESWESAVDHALTATELIYQHPVAHWTLGRALQGADNHPMARTAFEIALKQSPGFADAHDSLADLLEEHFDDESAVASHREAAMVARESTEAEEQTEIDVDDVQRTIDQRRKNRIAAGGNDDDWSEVPPEEIVTIVSGLPRSGTSMMMQMLEQGGIDPYLDGRRVADLDNPRGYYEHEKATRLGRDRSWIPEVRGSSVKIMAQLLPMLPPDQKYRIIFMDRDLREVAQSQRVMLERLGNAGGDLTTARMMQVLDAQVTGVERWMGRCSNIQCLFVDYGQTLENTEQIVAQLDDFLDGRLDRDAAVSAVDPDLRRQRTGG